jgi:protein SCO1/2
MKPSMLLMLGTACLLLPWTSNSASAQKFLSGSYGSPAGTAPGAEMLREVGIVQHLDGQLPLELTFRNEMGNSVKLGDYFGKQPVVLILAYYRCPMLCTQVLNGFLKSSQAIPLEIGRDYQVVTVSIDPLETQEIASQKHDSYTRAYRRPGANEGWHFLTGDQDQIDRLAQAVGFQYRYDPGSKQYAHASGIMLATPEGKLSRYFYGIEYPPPDLRLGLIESSAGRIGSPVDQLLLLCYHYDPLTGRYGLVISRVLQIAGLLTVLLVGSYIGVKIYRERRRNLLAKIAVVPTAAEGSVS